MTKFHINPETGNPGVCKATKRCRFGGDEQHFASKAEALLYSELQLAEEFSTSMDESRGFQAVDQVRTLAQGISGDLELHSQQAAAATEVLKPEEQIALRGYGGFAAGSVNEYLLAGKFNPYEQAPPWRTTTGPTDFSSKDEMNDYMTVLDSALSLRQTEERVLYRGIPIYSSIQQELQAEIGESFKMHEVEKLKAGLSKYFAIGKTFEYATYLSTSHSAAVAAERTDETLGTDVSYYDPKPPALGIQFELLTKAGVDITGVARSHYKWEREVVLPRGIKFRVANIHLTPTAYKTQISDETREGGELQNFSKIAAVVQMVEIE